MFRYQLRRPLDRSWMIAWTSCSIVLGVVAAANEQVLLITGLAWLLTAFALLGKALLAPRMWLVVLACVGGFIIGVNRGAVVQTDLAAYQNLYGKNVVITGILSDDPDTDSRGNLALRLNKIRYKSYGLTGSIWVTTRPIKDLKRGDTIELKGKLKEGFGTFAASMYQANTLNFMRTSQADLAIRVRSWFQNGVDRALQDTEASLGLGYVVGQRRGLPPELDEALQVAGLTHVVVASGYNLTILVRFARRAFLPISKFTSFAASSGLIASFIAITGQSPSMSRAGLVTGLSLLAWYYGRRFHPLVLLPLAMAVTTLLQPQYAWGDLGWQLSFAAFAGVMLLAPVLKLYFFADKKDQTIRQIFLETMSAQLFTLPILLLAFGKFSLIAPLANILILPLVPLAMLLTFIAGIGANIFPTLAQIFGFPAQALLEYMTQTIMYVGSLSWAQQEWQVGIWVAIGMYTAIVLAMLYMKHVTGYRYGSDSITD